MSNGDRSDQLAQKVDRVIDENDLPTFEEYWELYKRAAFMLNVQRFFVSSESQFPQGGHCNVAIIGSGLLVDIEGDESSRSGSLTLERLDSITSVSIHAGPLPGLSDSQGATLVVLAHGAGETDAGLHWVAKTEEEDVYLLSFAQSLVRAISKQ